MTKVALVNVFFPPQTIGGATRVVSDNIDDLIKDYSEDVELVGFCSQSDCRKPYEVEVMPYKGFKVYRANVNFRENMDWHAKDETFYNIFKDFLEFEKPDLVHFHCVQRMTASIVEAAFDLEVPYVITVHDAWWISDYQFLIDQGGRVYHEGHPDLYEERNYPKGVTPTQSLERSLYLKKLLNGANKVLHVSKSFEEIYRKNGVGNSLVTKNGISSSINWEPKETGYTSKVVLGHIGGMSDHKGYDIFTEMLVQADGSKLEAIIVDHSQDSGYLKEETIGSVSVKFIGRQPQSEICKLYQKIDVLFAPSKWPESFGLVTREAVACGCWVVASNIGGIGEDIHEDNGFVVEPSLEGLGLVLLEICNDTNKYKGVSANSDKITSKKQAERIFKEVYKVISK